jgi:polyisoprenoid-binding protein YceI
MSGVRNPHRPQERSTDANSVHLFFYVHLELVESSTILGYDYWVPKKRFQFITTTKRELIMSVLATLPAGTFNIDPSHSRVGFSARHAMVTKVRGSFNDYTGAAVVADGAASINIDITVASIDTRSADRDGHLQSADFFDAANFPKITFASTSVKDSGSDKIAVEGNLTIKDVTKAITIEFEYTGTATDPFGNARFGFEGEAEINRKDFGLTWNAALETGGILVSENIKLEFEISTIAAK